MTCWIGTFATFELSVRNQPLNNWARCHTRCQWEKNHSINRQGLGVQSQKNLEDLTESRENEIFAMLCLKYDMRSLYRSQLYKSFMNTQQ